MLTRDLFALFVQQSENISTDTERRAGLSAIAELRVRDMFTVILHIAESRKNAHDFSRFLSTSMLTQSPLQLPDCLGAVMFPSFIRWLATLWTYVLHFSFCLTLPRGVLSTYLCCPSRPCVFFFACVHLTLFLALSLSSGNSLVSLTIV